MNLSNINTVARCEANIVRCTWLFRAFALFSLLGISILQIVIQGNLIQWTSVKMIALSSWNMIALSSYVPYLNVYLFGIAQAVVVVFLIAVFLDKDRNIKAIEMMCARSFSNADYMIGKALGVILIFMTLSLVSLVLGAIINIFLSDAPFNGWMYLFYWIVFLFPSLVFVLGLTFLGMGLISNKSSFILDLLLFVFFIVYYSGNFWAEFFNFLGLIIPSTLSDISGYPDLGGVLLQRLIWLLLGIGFIGYSIVLLNCKFKRLGGGTVWGVLTWIVVLGLVCSISLCLGERENTSLRKSYRITYEKYRSNPRLTLNDQIITYRQDEDKLKVNTNLRLKNERKGRVHPVILYLNPGLQVDRISKNGEKVDFFREKQVIVIEDTVEEEGILDLEIEYSGKIDESICYLEFPNGYVADTWSIGSELFRAGKRYAFWEKDYTLLTPECIWYPVSVPPVSLSDVYAVEKNFTKYGLQVIGENERTVLSQGDRSESGDTVIFKNKHGLPGISLCIGNYKSYQLMVDSVSFELYLTEGHDDFMENLSRVKDSMPTIIHAFKHKVEQQMNRKYPFEHFRIVETPVSFAAYFRNERGGSERVQPEMLFLPERGVGFWSMNVKKFVRDYQNMPVTDKMNDVELERKVLTQILENLFATEYGSCMEIHPFMKLFANYSNGSYALNVSPFTLTPMFYHHVNQWYSPEYPVMDMVLNNLLCEPDDVGVSRINDWKTGSSSYKQALNYLKGHSMDEALKDPQMTSDILHQLIKLKSGNLKEQYFGSTISSADFNEFIKQYWEKHKFEKIDFSSFNKAFTEQFGRSWLSVLPKWYSIKRIPSFLIQDAYVEEIEDKKEDRSLDDRRYRIHAKVYNEGEVDGVVTLSYTEISNTKNNDTAITSEEMKLPCTKNVLIGAKEGKEIVLVTKDKPSAVFLNTVISTNVPTVVVLEENEETTCETEPGVRDIDISYFLPKVGELVVDNESESFSLLQASMDNRRREWFQPVYSIDKYNAYNNMMASEKWYLVAHFGFYGERSRSGWMKKCGNGESKAKWSVKIEKAGYYKVFAYIPKYVGLQRDKRISATMVAVAQSHANTIKQNYLVQHDDKETEVAVEVIALNTSWISLGRFYFSSGEASVVLTDKGSVDDQNIYADAVKWVLDVENKMSEK